MARGFTCGAFDLLHPGHLYLFEFAKRHCDYLIVGLHTNPQRDRREKNMPVQTTFERWKQLSAVKYIDEIIPYDTEDDLKNLFATVDIRVRFLGTDYAGRQYYTAKELCQQLNMTTIYVPRHHSFSSSSIRTRLLEAASCTVPSSSTVME